MANLINRTQVRNFLLEKLESDRKLSNGQPRFTRVSRETLDNIEAEFLSLLRRKVQLAPRTGATL